MGASGTPGYYQVNVFGATNYGHHLGVILRVDELGP